MSTAIQKESTHSAQGGILSNFPSSARAIALVAALVAGCSPPPPSPTEVGSFAPPVATSPVTPARASSKDIALGLSLPDAMLRSQSEAFLTKAELRVLVPQTARDLATLVREVSNASSFGSLYAWKEGHPKETQELLTHIDGMRRTLSLFAQNEQTPYRTEARALFESLGQVGALIRNDRPIGLLNGNFDSRARTDNSNDMVIAKAVAQLEWYAHCLEK